MIRGLALLALVGVAFCEKFFEMKAPYHKDVDPEVANAVRRRLNREDLAAIMAVAARYDQYNNHDEALLGLKEENAATYEKLKILDDLVENKIENLEDEEAKALARKVVAEFHRLYALHLATSQLSREERRNRLNLETLKAQAAEFKALSRSAQAQFEEEFPFITSVLKSKYRTLETEFLEYTN